MSRFSRGNRAAIYLGAPCGGDCVGAMDDAEVEAQLAKFSAATTRVRLAREAGDDNEVDAAIEDWDRALAPLLDELRNRLKNGDRS